MTITPIMQLEDGPVYWTPAEFFLWARISRSKGYDLLRTGELRSIHIGRSIRIPRTAIQEYMQAKEKSDEQVPRLAVLP